MLNVSDNQADFTELMHNTQLLNVTHKHLRYTPLMYAIQVKGRQHIAIELLQRNANIHIKDVFGNTAIHTAAQFDCGNIMGRLLEAGANVHDCGADGDTPLHIAAYHGNMSVLQILHDAGAQVNTLNVFGMTALQMSVCNIYIDISMIKHLMQWGSHINPPNWHAQSALQMAVMHESIEVVDLLLNAGADPNYIDKFGTTPLEIAVINKNFVISRRLLRANANIYKDSSNIPTSDSKQSLFELALQSKCDNRLCKMLLSSGTLMSRENWFFQDNMPDDLNENEEMLEVIQQFARNVPTLERLCILRIREWMSSTNKFEHLVNTVVLPKSLKLELFSIVEDTGDDDVDL